MNELQIKIIQFSSEESKKLVDQGINIIIALVHSGFSMDKQVALNCPDVDIVVGGHTNTFLSNNASAPAGHPERIEGNYPTIIKQENGREVYVVQAAAFTKYMGKAVVKVRFFYFIFYHITYNITFQFDDDGELVSFEGQPILLDSSIPQEQDVLDLLDLYRVNITALENDQISTTKVELEGGKICRKRECIMGNILTEAMVYNRVKAQLLSNKFWTDAAIAFYNGGGIRSPIELHGPITSSDVLTALPFQSSIIMAQVRGKTIHNALEHSAKIFSSQAAGGFLQMYGAKVIYNMNNTIGQRVLEVRLLCSECDVPKYEKLESDKKYTILLSDFLHDGGDNYVFREKDNHTFIELGVTDSDVFIDYLRDQRFIYPALDGRISFKSGGITLLPSCFVMVITVIWFYFQ